jgi:cardiolipin synthase (CMP-forming)
VLLTYANQLTILRMIFVPCFVLLLIYGHIGAATLVFALAGVTDALDGLLARKLDQRTSLGSYLDPMADKILLTAAFVTLAIKAVPIVEHIPVWLTVLTISRDVIIALSALIIHLRTGHSDFPPSLLGKCTTTVQLITVAACMVANFITAGFLLIFHAAVYASLILTVASGLHYAWRSAQFIEAHQQAVPDHDKSRT